MSVQSVFSESTFRQTLSRSDATTLIVVDFYAEWCGPCHALAPKLEALAKKYKDNATFLKVDVDKMPQISSKYSVSAMPTIVFIKNNKTLDTVVGADVGAIQKCIDRFYEMKTKAFSGTGYKLGGSSIASSSGIATSVSENKPNLRRSKLVDENTNKATVQDSKPDAKEHARQSCPASDEVELKIKFVDTRTLSHVFKTSQTIRDVHDWVTRNFEQARYDDASGPLPPPKQLTPKINPNDLYYTTWSEYFGSFVPEFLYNYLSGVWRGLKRISFCPKSGHQRFYLSKTFPKKIYKTPEDLSKTLKEEDLVSRAQLQLVEL